ncbi:MAG TPA: flippase activity-associated protein Agl23, partial [Thermomicrobiaceae bacterium]|nr:flippase activity-associated protein Agl23 [Thermomicrobiaceae bacterium]
MTHRFTTATEPITGGGTGLRIADQTKTAPVRLPSIDRRPGKLLPSSISLETACYALIFMLAILTRFWDLGSRALHHDESLHSYYSWVFAEGGGYRHDPLMHGPFLFHANALAYLLFGTTDYVSRVMPAVAGVIIVMLPWLLRGRQQLGQWGALTASVLLLISPSILYYSRFIRHDIYCLLGTFVLAIAILRYLETPQPRWAITGGISIGFLFCTKEVSFIVIFIFVTFLGLAIAWRSAKGLIAIGVLALVAFFAADKALHGYGVAKLPGIPWDNPTNKQVAHFAGQLISNPIILAALGIGLLAIVFAILLLD